MLADAIYHIDASNQIHNTWYKNTAVGICDDKGVFFFSINISSNLKLKIRDKLKEYPPKSVNCNLLAYLVFLIFRYKEEHFKSAQIKTTWLCPDVRPTMYYIKCLSKCFSRHGKHELFDHLSMKIKKPTEKSKAHGLTRKVFQHKKNPTIEFNSQNMNDFIEYFIKLSEKK